jgi:hypothetical protein
MRRSKYITGTILACLLSVAVGFWLGFREAWTVGISADFLPRGLLATHHIQSLKAGQTEKVVGTHELEIDNGLLFGSDFLDHPLRPLLSPIWGIGVSADYERYASRLADFRKTHPSPNTWESDPHIRARIDASIERYATKK